MIKKHENYLVIMPEPTTKTRRGHERFYEFLKLMEETHDKKNADYSKDGDPLSNLRTTEKIGVPAIFGNYARLGDKWERFTNIMHRWFVSGNHKAYVENETIVDTLLDLANYCILQAILIEEHLKKSEGKAKP